MTNAPRRQLVDGVRGITDAHGRTFRAAAAGHGIHGTLSLPLVVDKASVVKASADQRSAMTAIPTAAPRDKAGKADKGAKRGLTAEDVVSLNTALHALRESARQELESTYISWR